MRVLLLSLLAAIAQRADTAEVASLARAELGRMVGQRPCALLYPCAAARLPAGTVSAMGINAVVGFIAIVRTGTA